MEQHGSWTGWVVSYNTCTVNTAPGTDETQPARTAGPDQTYLDLDFTMISTYNFCPHTRSCLIAGIVNVYGHCRE